METNDARKLIIFQDILNLLNEYKNPKPKIVNGKPVVRTGIFAKEVSIKTSSGACYSFNVKKDIFG